MAGILDNEDDLRKHSGNMFFTPQWTSFIQTARIKHYPLRGNRAFVSCLFGLSWFFSPLKFSLFSFVRFDWNKDEGSFECIFLGVCLSKKCVIYYVYFAQKSHSALSTGVFGSVCVKRHKNKNTNHFIQIKFCLNNENEWLSNVFNVHFLVHSSLPRF